MKDKQRKIVLYHAGYQVIERPDIRYGRKNADFGQGFYLSDDLLFSKRWVREKKGQSIHINFYELNIEDLKIKEFDRGQEWVDYIFNNRAAKEDYLAEYDVIIGPIANDTLYNSFGIISSGFLTKEEALSLLNEGPIYHQIVIKTDKALRALTWTREESIAKEEAISYKRQLEEEEVAFQEAIANRLEKMESE